MVMFIGSTIVEAGIDSLRREPLEELLLRDSREATHEQIGDALLGSVEPAQALARLGLLAETIDPERVAQELSIPEHQVTG